MQRAGTRRSERLHIRISRSEKRDLSRLARECDMTASQIIRRALKRELASGGKRRIDG